jgi:hypothetical protein
VPPDTWRLSVSRAVEESDLDFHLFRCCGDEDLYPFGCPRCGRLMVFCYECDTLYGHLENLDHHARSEVNHFDPTQPIFSCPGCGYAFEYWFIRDGRYKALFKQWVEAGFGHLLNHGE